MPPGAAKFFKKQNKSCSKRTQGVKQKNYLAGKHQFGWITPLPSCSGKRQTGRKDKADRYR
jgi:hypothetical protein